jgi:ATP-dependent RNA helicase DHX57
LGDNLRSDLETVIKAHTVWNINAVMLSEATKVALTQELAEMGFRAAHAREAMDCVSSREEAIEWLLVHVPEDDLPRWAMPSTYSAGVSLASADPARDNKIKRLARAGYGTDSCVRFLKENEDNELAALEALQSSLVPPRPADASALNLDLDVWQEEMTTLEAILANRFVSTDAGSCSVTLEDVGEVACKLHFYKPASGYPDTAVPLVIAEASVPAQVRLSALRQCLTSIWEAHLGDQMLYAIIEWYETNLTQVLSNPGRLVDIDMDVTEMNLQRISDKTHEMRKGKAPVNARGTLRSMPRDRRNDQEIKQDWEGRQASAQQKEMLKARQSLPAWNKRHELVDAINSKQVTLITGETGSGKSTQCLQFVLDDAIQRGVGSTCTMICTQPRRVAALSLSDRVAAERCVAEGTEVGYTIRGASKTSAQTKITFMTTGILLRRLQLSKTPEEALRGISHVFVDEVHERSVDTDFLLALLKTVLKGSKLKVVLMSATVDADVFSNYFGGPSSVARGHIEGRTFPVQDVYLDAVLQLTGHVLQQPDDEVHEREVGKAIQSLGMGINYDLIAALVEGIDSQLASDPGGILIFLPGTLEIDRCLRAVSRLPKMYALPLHASLLPSEQKKVFPRAPHGTRKVICATNVAETSITISDIVAVIDTGRVKETAYDVNSNMVRLQEVWASKAQCKQRRGRAGRTQPGTNYKMYTKTVESSMRDATAPEMNRIPLEQLCLNVKATAPSIGPTVFLRQVISPPSEGAVSSALATLHRVGALEDGRLTGLGTYMSMLPADLRLAKLVILGTIFSCLEPTLTMAAILSVKSPFVSPRDKREEARAARLSFSSADGDLMLDLAAFAKWKQQQTKSARARELNQWCATHFLSAQTLRDIDSTRHQLLDALKEADLVAASYRSPPSDSLISSKDSNSQAGTHNLNAQASNTALLRALILGALSPNIAEIRLPDKKFIASLSGAKELDPEARTIKFFAEGSASASASDVAGGNASGDIQETTTARSSSSGGGQQQQQRVFIHPSSALFDAQTFTGHAAYLSYFSKVATSKVFVRDLTPVNAYGVLLFAGGAGASGPSSDVVASGAEENSQKKKVIEVDTKTGVGLVVDGWLHMRGWARIGVLVSRLRAVLDAELRRCVEAQAEGVGGGSGGGVGGGAGLAGFDARIVGVVRRLVELNGQDL